MKQEKISLGDILILKPNRAHAYGERSDTQIIVTDIKQKAIGYKTEWIISNNKYFKPCDFLKKISEK